MLRDVATVVQRQRVARFADDEGQRVDDDRAGDGASIIDGLDALVDAGDGWGLLAAFTPEGLERLRDAGRTFRELRARLGVPLPDLVRIVEEELRLDIEVVANESRTGGIANLRQFRDALESFLRVDDFGTLTSFLDWVDRAIQADEAFGPVDAPKQPGVVQLLTIHGAKGLEWEVVALPRFVEHEFPADQRGDDTSGWIGFGKLPYEFRGDADVLREQAWFDWDDSAVSDRKELSRRFDEFKAGIKRRHADEERRLAYVAVTRAQRDLLVSGSFWPDWRSKPRALSPFVDDLDRAGLVKADLPRTSALGEEPAGGEERRPWPWDPLGDRRAKVEAAAEAVREAIAAGDGPLGRWGLRSRAAAR